MLHTSIFAEIPEESPKGLVSAPNKIFGGITRDPIVIRTCDYVSLEGYFVSTDTKKVQNVMDDKEVNDFKAPV